MNSSNMLGKNESAEMPPPLQDYNKKLDENSDNVDIDFSSDEEEQDGEGGRKTEIQTHHHNNPSERVRNTANLIKLSNSFKIEESKVDKDDNINNW